MFASTRTLAIVLAAACVAGTPAAAQAVDSVGTTAAGGVDGVAAAPVKAGPRIATTAIAVRQTPLATEPREFQRAQPAQGAGMGKPLALILVGATAIVVGDVIDDDVGTLFTIGGAVMLLVGLYQFLK
jgi:hypothetical protein